MEELKNIRWDIVGLSKVHREEKKLVQLKDGHHLFYYRGKDRGKSSGVGFLSNRDIAGNLMKFSSLSDRVAWIVIRLIKKYSLKILLVYAPTSQSSDNEIESFYDDLRGAMNQEKTKYTLVIEDFNAKVGKNLVGKS